jgi:hypothetical protein
VLAATCIAEATAFQTSCAAYITPLISATGGQVTSTSDAQIATLVAQLKAAGYTPSATCCPVATSLFANVSSSEIWENYAPFRVDSLRPEDHLFICSLQVGCSPDFLHTSDFLLMLSRPVLATHQCRPWPKQSKASVHLDSRLVRHFTDHCTIVKGTAAVFAARRTHSL